MAKMNQKRELGKGIRALLGEIDNEINDGQIDKNSVLNNPKGSSTSMVPIHSIEVNPFQPRVNFDEEALNELASSIKIHGIIQPLTVRELSKDKFQLISGERRLRASKLAGLEEVPVYIRTANDQEALEMALIENIQREELNAIEIGMNYQRLIDECELNHDSLAERVGKKRSTISNYIRLLKLPPDIQVAVREDKISMGHARALAGVDEIDMQLSIFNEVIDKSLSVRQTEALVANRLEFKKNKKPASRKIVSPEIRQWQDELSSELGTKVAIQSNNGKGSIVVPFHSEEELARIIELIVK
jgi:ParB family chromosome partitioning protein